MRSNCVRVVMVVVMLATASAVGAGDNPQARPFWGQLEGEATIYPAPACDAYLGLQTATLAVGNMLHLGLTEMFATHCPTAEYTNEDGVATFTAANGDQVSATYFAWTVAPPPSVVQEVHMMIDGGTGRFENALGVLEGKVYVDLTNPQPPWPIKLVLTGTIRY